MKSVKMTKRKKLRVVAAEPRRAAKRRTSRQVTARQGLRTANSRRGDKTGGRVSGKRSQGLDISARKSTEAKNGDGKLLATVKQFEVAVRFFHKENYNKAREILQRLADTAPPEVVDRAQVYLRLCERRRSTAPAARTVADNYLFGVAELNAGRPDSAVHYLEKAHKLEPKRDDVCYALAACYALQSKAGAALEQLKAAIDLRPQNRFQARLDPDFQSLAGDPRFGELVHPASLNLRTAL